jgi:hypothetical protein
VSAIMPSRTWETTSPWHAEARVCASEYVVFLDHRWQEDFAVGDGRALYLRD